MRLPPRNITPRNVVFSLLGVAVFGIGLALYLWVLPRSGVYRGRYSYGFEHVAFQPCGSSEQWWVTGGEVVQAATRQLLRDHPSTRPDGGFEAYVEWKGARSGPGEYGHMGAYQRELEVDEVLVMRPPADGDC